MRKWFYCKCPRCQEYAIPAFLKVGRGAYTVRCRSCNGKFKGNTFLAILINIFSSCIIGVIALLVNQYIIRTPIWIWILPFLVLNHILSYILPIKEVERASTSKTINRIQRHNKRR